MSSQTWFVIKWFWQLSQTRNHNDNGPLPITYQEIQAWMGLFRMNLSAMCIELIRLADSVYLEGMAQEIKEDRARNG